MNGVFRQSQILCGKEPDSPVIRQSLQKRRKSAAVDNCGVFSLWGCWFTFYLDMKPQDQKAIAGRFTEPV